MNYKEHDTRSLRIVYELCESCINSRIKTANTISDPELKEEFIKSFQSEIDRDKNTMLGIEKELESRNLTIK